MDGVLFDSMKNHTLAWQKAMAARGISADRNEFYLYEGCTGKGTIDQFFRRIYGREADEKEVEQIYQAKSRFFNEMPTVEIMPCLLYTSVRISVNRKNATVYWRIMDHHGHSHVI